MISIQPKWCELIANGEKTVEVRKTRPKLETPFLCYIYCTKDKQSAFFTKQVFDGEKGKWAIPHLGNGKVIGEFVCDNVIQWNYFEKLIILGGKTSTYMPFTDDLKSTCLSYDEFAKYGNGKTLYGWHISDLVIYDKPKELSEFEHYCNGLLPLTRPYQSWGYVEEMGVEE